MAASLQKKILILLITLLYGYVYPAHAGGSVELRDIQALLSQQPVIWKFYTDNFDISPNGGGLRLGSFGIPLRGYRVGPYNFRARVKGSKDDFPFKIIITTDIYFLDEAGNETNDEKKATKVEEVITSIGLAPKEYHGRDGSYLRTAD